MSGSESERGVSRNGFRTGVNRRWSVARRPVGLLRPGDVDLVEAPVPEPGDGEFVVRVTTLAFDPAQLYWLSRDSYVPATPIGDTVPSFAAGEVVRSRRDGVEVGAMMQGMFGWQDFCLVSDDAAVPLRCPSPEKALNVLGLTGLTAYFGMTQIARPSPHDTVVVSAAAGATGSIASQIARASGARVIGIAGGAEKCRWATEVARLDACIDYRSQDVAAELRRLAPDGISVAFENVGGAILDAVLDNLAIGARIALCGGISSYVPGDAQDVGIRNYMQLGLRRASMSGFLVFDYEHQFDEAVTRLRDWLADGTIVSIEDVQRGLENAPETLNRIYRGLNVGKQLLTL